MKLEALKHQGLRTDLTSAQVGTKLQRADESVAAQAGSSCNQIQRYIRLTELIPPLIDMVDEKRIAFNPAVELSYLKQEEQQLLLTAMDSEQVTPSLSQAQRMKKFSQISKLSNDVILTILSEEKKPEMDKLTLTGSTLRQYFPKTYTPQQMEQVILRLLDQWQKRRKQEQSR